ncbi:MAG: putative CRISPR-associated protein [Bacteroidia bacterium]|nr:putative CRISPR-associated protein [Bacteroidia bacterium]MDW8301953.1 putative CRISPR-associated protein [Bacteroidia bacterium]
MGTSLFEGNLKKLSEGNLDLPENWQSIKSEFDKQNWDGLAKELLKVEPSERICGAEINTIEEIKKKKWIELKNIILLVSDTELGKNTGIVLKKYLESREDLRLKHVEFKAVEQLQDQQPKIFKMKGLRNLVKEIGDYVYRYSHENVAIDATGGYKAQIAIAVLIGQALNLPVYYKHERFSEIIDFPPLPISLDYDILGQNSDILTDFERGKVYTATELKNFDEKLRVFLNEVEVDNETLFELNPIGQIYLTSFRLRFQKNFTLKSLDDTQRKEPTFASTHHYPTGFKEFVQKVWRENKWIKTCWSLDYSGQRAIKGIGFSVKLYKGKNIILGTYEDRNNFCGKFQVVLSDESNDHLNWAVDELNQKYRNT